MRKFALLLAAGLRPLSARAETHTLTLKQAVDRALAQNPEVVMARLDEAKASLGVRVATQPVHAARGRGQRSRLHQRIPAEHRRIGAGCVRGQRRANTCSTSRRATPSRRRRNRRAAPALPPARKAMRSRTAWHRFISMRTAPAVWPIRRRSRSRAWRRFCETARARVEEGRELAVTAQEANVNLLRARQRLIAFAERSRLCLAQSCRNARVWGAAIWSIPRKRIGLLRPFRQTKKPPSRPR